MRNEHITKRGGRAKPELSEIAKAARRLFDLIDARVDLDQVDAIRIGPGYIELVYCDGSAGDLCGWG